MTIGRTGRAGLAAVVLAMLVAAAGACTGGSPAGSTGSPPGSPATSPSPSPAAHLRFTLSSVSGRTSTGHRLAGHTLRGPASAVRTAITQLYATGFVDPDRWAGAKFPSLGRSFAAPVRPTVRRHLGSLSLGAAARKLDEVVPTRARLQLRFLTDRARHPVAAFASVDFRGTGIAGDVHVKIAQQARYTLGRLNGAWRVETYRARNHVPSPGTIRAKVQSAAAPEAVPSSGLLFLLAIGSDARPGQGLSTRGDSLHIIGVNPSRGRASIVGIPRDSWVEIPGHGMNKINSALSYGGPSLMVQTVEHLTGIHLDGYALTGFADFVKLVNAVGGVDVDIPYPINDHYSHAHFRPGPAHLNGRSALAFSRNRHDAPGGDIGRSLNQGRLLIGAFRDLRDQLAKDPASVIPWAVAGSRYLVTDIPFSRMLQLLLASGSIAPGHVGNRVVGGRGAVIGGQDVILLDAQAHALFRNLRADAIVG